MSKIAAADASAKSKYDAACDATTSSCPPEKKPDGKVELYAAAFDVKYDVCDDKIADFADYKNVFLLKDSGKYYHWLKTRTDPDDANKPGTAAGPIPVTLSSEQAMKVAITFRTIEPWSGFFVRVTDSAGKYRFEKEKSSSRSSGGKGALFELSFTCDTPLPYQNSVQYLPAFSLKVEVSKDGAAWSSLGSIPVCLYLTYDEPGYNALSPGPPEPEATLKLSNDASSRSTILESLLYIGCRYASGAKTADEILRGVFAHVKGLAVGRARDSAAMGYWRNTSSLHNSSMAFRGGRVLLKSGEARCGEWTAFLGDLLVIQSRSLFSGKLSSFAIVNNDNPDPSAPGFTKAGFLVKPWKLNGHLTPEDGGGRAQDLSNKPLNIFWDHVFMKYDDKYFDPSYGLDAASSFASDALLLRDYSDKGLAGVVLAKDDSAHTIIPAIRYLAASGAYIHPLRAYRLFSVGSNQYRYNIIRTRMDEFLEPSVYAR